MIDLSVSIGELKFKNPIMVSAGDPTLSTKLTLKSIQTGAGSVVIKTCSFHEEEYIVTRGTRGFPDRYVEKGNYMNLSPGIAFKTPDEEAEIIREVKSAAQQEGCVVIASIAAPARAWDEWERMAALMEEAGADAIEIMMCCPVPQVPGLGADGATEENLREILTTIKKKARIPLIMKTSETHPIFLAQLAKGIDVGGADAWHVQGHANMPVIDVESGETMLPPGAGWGRPQRGIGVEACFIASNLTTLPRLSSGGIYDWRSTVERLMAGATLAGIHSEITYNGFKVIPEILRGVEEFLGRKGHREVRAIIGTALHCASAEWKRNWYTSHALAKEKIDIYIEKMKCSGCGICADCIFDAVNIDKLTKKAEIDLMDCERCGRCVSMCPKNAIVMHIDVDSPSYM